MNEERRKLIEQKKRGHFNLIKHLNEHPISGILSLIKLSDDHPLLRLRNEQRKHDI
jgi:hypothetical protein